ncbi:MAG: hypothetical protein E7222_15015 [Clostridiales bacterium]|jgi:DNA-binding SARP family transcriptional activator|nr:hypothetical protein [Clostridiales bacterium]
MYEIGGIPMESEPLHISMLGSLELEYQGVTINDKDNRGKKTWLLLALLAYNRNSKVSQDRVLSFLGNEFKESANPQNALRTLFHRLRGLIAPLGENIGQELFLCKKGEYFLNPDFSYELDIDIFESLMQEARNEMDPARRSELFLQALSLYRGDFLSKYTSETWVVPITTYYHKMFLEAADGLVTLYESRQEYETAIDFLNDIHFIDPYEESFYRHLMINMFALGHMEEVIQLYKQLSDMLLVNFDETPSDEVKSIYQKAMFACNSCLLESSVIHEQLMADVLREQGALYCDYETFVKIFHAIVRGLETNPIPMHLAIMTITDLTGNVLSKRSLDICVTRMKDFLSESLNKGDVISMCSPAQFLILLVNQTTETAHKVCQRLDKSFFHMYPHSPAKLTFDIQQLLSPDSE